MASPLRLGTRGSQLALYQAGAVARLVEQAGGPPCEIAIIKTSGDRLQDAPLSEMGGKGLFVKEIEDALLRHQIDIAVHSSKDMPAVLPEGLTIAASPPRADPHDTVVLPRNASAEARASSDVADLGALLARLGPAPSIGTSSVRRVAQLMRLLPGARFTAIRGNLDTRLHKLDAGEYDAIVLAAAGLHRLGFDARMSFRLPLDVCVPAPGQGIIAVEIRADDERARTAVRSVSDALTEAALTAERALVEALGGGCQTPIGAIALPDVGGQLRLQGLVVSLDGQRAARAEGCGRPSEARALGLRVASALLAQGAAEILAETRTAPSATPSHGHGAP